MSPIFKLGEKFWTMVLVVFRADVKFLDISTRLEDFNTCEYSIFQIIEFHLCLTPFLSSNIKKKRRIQKLQQQKI